MDSLYERLELYITEHNEFFPFGSVIQEDGKIRTVGAYSETEDIQEMIDLLKELITCQPRP